MTYGHFNFKGMKTLLQKQMVTGLPSITTPSKTCEECVIGKHQRDTFPRGKPERAKVVLELIHLDLCGPINPTSNGKNILYRLLTILGGRLGCIFCRKNQMPAKHSKISRL